MHQHADSENDRATWIEYRFILEPCTFIRGILSDNKFHPNHPAWFAGEIGLVAAHSGQPVVSAFIEWLTGDDLTGKAWAWRAIGEYHGFDNLDSYPNSFTREEIEARYPRATWKV